MVAAPQRLDPVGYDINKDPQRWAKLTRWRVVAEMVGAAGQDSLTGSVAIPPVQHGVLSNDIVRDATWQSALAKIYQAKPAFAGTGPARGAHFVGDGQAVRHGSSVTVHIDRVLPARQVVGIVAVLPTASLVYADMQVGDWVSGGGNYLGDVEINLPSPNDPTFPLPVTGTVVSFDSDTMPPPDGLDGGTFRIRAMPVPAFYITLESTDCVDKGKVRQHKISPDPKMPDLVVRMPVVGLTAQEDAALVRQVTLTVTYPEGGRGAKDKKVFKATVTGPEWRPNWGGTFCGGDVAVDVRATLPWGEKIKGVVAAGTHVIRGCNPTRATIRAALGSMYTEVIGYQESKFTQFGKAARVAFQPKPNLPLRAPDNGFGIGQLTKLPPGVPQLPGGLPTTGQLWSWQENTSTTVDVAQRYRARAAKLVGAVYRRYKGAPQLTEDQIDEIGWQFYNSGPGHDPYWQYDAKRKRWTEHPIGDYVKKCRRWRAAVNAGKPPPGWS